MLGDLLAIVVIAGIAGAVGLVFGIVVLAPRIGRLLDRHEEPGDRPD